MHYFVQKFNLVTCIYELNLTLFQLIDENKNIKFDLKSYEKGALGNNSLKIF